MRNKGESNSKNYLQKIVLLVALMIFIFSAYKLIKIQLTYREGEKEYEKLEQYITVEDHKNEEQDKGKNSDIEESNNQYPKKPKVDFESLKAINKDVIGWIEMPGIDISYPLVQANDNDYYLHKTFEKKENIAGAIFMEAQNNKEFQDPNTIIYGHNMKNGSMFGKLKQYLEQEKYEQSPYIWIVTPEKSYLYQIFSSFETPVNSQVYTLFSSREQEFEEYLKDMKEQSRVSNDVQVKKEDTIITLSTCTANSNTRCVAMAKQILVE